ncbi:hypothetical protein SEVIR_9G362100v4 [Setaria viridis]|uniref:Uncharacterized protein n=2 Tax=Setaria TaxID=4554 RepID=K4AFI5_SETIT|nr:uncharacterized protein LOC101760286 [Setaria italica]XP_034572462.1 uncharacterized protein LOC117837022 [Setaria viridis]XP_034572463.1 uncharacterized protein LOC117837022 [Setaria viridis]XP_034572464.1 uncharacterized protein LOC117837022 [Setaria viridis]RCV44216.1 hypothetical protein SETIT_9G356200v2 [Setaria italica]RCV44217.1 hypothetical protein SETIT_9G356200v2 [Setaria italica]RCV44218.1 hypothetical protein SETIT_9G356200v2 [Setaria italica]TKV95416.1 hypothetical protein SE
MSRYHLKQYEKEHMKMAMLKQEETFKQQVQELHRLYRVQKLLMTDAASAATAMPAATRCDLEDERRAAENDAGSSRSWDDAYPEKGKKAAAPRLVLQESDLELTLSLGCFGTTGATNKAAKKEASSSVDSRTSGSSSSTESGSPDRRVVVLPAPSLIGSATTKPGAGSVGQRLEQDGLQQPPWLHKCLNLAR